MDMKKYDVIVIGSGCGMNIVEEALGYGMSVALVDKGPLGGTCANLGCIFILPRLNLYRGHSIILRKYD